MLNKDNVSVLILFQIKDIPRTHLPHKIKKKHVDDSYLFQSLIYQKCLVEERQNAGML